LFFVTVLVTPYKRGVTPPWKQVDFGSHFGCAPPTRVNAMLTTFLATLRNTLGNTPNACKACARKHEQAVLYNNTVIAW
jgi:hypothetical protein